MILNVTKNHRTSQNLMFASGLLQIHRFSHSLNAWIKLAP